jgi:hypothetical protein
VIKAGAAYGGTLSLIWFVVLAVRHIPFGAQLSEPRRDVLLHVLVAFSQRWRISL